MTDLKSLSVPELLLLLELDSATSFAEIQSAFLQQITAWDPTMPSLEEEEDLQAIEKFIELKAVFSELRKRWPAWERSKNDSYRYPLELQSTTLAQSDFSKEYSDSLLRLRIKRWVIAVATTTILIGFLASVGYPSKITAKVKEGWQSININLNN